MIRKFIVSISSLWVSASTHDWIYLRTVGFQRVCRFSQACVLQSLKPADVQLVSCSLLVSDDLMQGYW